MVPILIFPRSGRCVPPWPGVARRLLHTNLWPPSECELNHSYDQYEFSGGRL